MTPVLEVAGATVRFGPVEVVRDVSLTVDAGRTVGLVGPNGAGKSTLLDAISGLVPLARGCARLAGVDVTRVAPHRRARLGLGRTFQGLDLFEDLTVAENVLVAAESAGSAGYGVSPAGLDDHSLPSALPAGRRRDLALDRALAGRPRILLLDEPAAGLDAAGRKALAARLRAANDSGVGVLLVDHDVELVLGLCQHVVVLDFGRVIAAGPPQSVRTDPAVTDAYLGAEAVASASTPSRREGEVLAEATAIAAGYGGAPVLHGVELTVRAGEVVALLGPNGAGKTTMLRVLSGLLTPEAGGVAVLGGPVHGRPDRLVRRGLAHVPQDRAVLASLTVAENLRLAPRGRRVARDDAVADALARLPALGPLAGRRAGSLSGGEQQLLAVARALARRPRLLLLDEPSTGLAPRAAREVLDAARDLAGDGTAVVLAEQHPRLALEIADRAVVLSRGGVVFDGPSATLAGDPAILEEAYLGRDAP